MSDSKDVYLLNPVNKTASIVSSQAGCSDSFIDEEQGLIDALKWIESKITTLKRGVKKDEN